VLLHCWLGGRKSTQPVKILSDEVLVWLSVRSEVQVTCILSTSSRCLCHSVISVSVKVQNALSFWCRLTQVVLRKRPLNKCCYLHALYSLTSRDHDVQLSGMRGAVRRMPHHGRSAANPRTRRAAANVQYQSSAGSTMMVLSPGERDRDPMDPIAGLYRYFVLTVFVTIC